MTIHDDGQRDKWLAYALGELPEAERAGVEAELAADPGELERLQQTIATVRAWAREAASGEAADVSAIVSEARHGGSRRDTNAGQSILSGVPRWVWGVAAAALFLIALGQVQFSVTVGGATFAWGSAQHVSDATPDPALAAKVEELAARHAAAEQQLALMRNQYEALVHSVKGTAEALAYSQQVESATRYRDVQQLLQLAGSR